MSDPAETLELDRLLALFFLAWRGFAAEPDEILAREGLGRVHHRILFMVGRLPGTRVLDLAATLGISRQALHRPLSELRKRRLVSVTASPTNGREKVMRLTSRGEELEERASGAQRAQLARAFAALGPDAATGWAAVMQALAAPVISRSPGLVGQVVQGE